MDKSHRAVRSLVLFYLNSHSRWFLANLRIAKLGHPRCLSSKPVTGVGILPLQERIGAPMRTEPSAPCSCSIGKGTQTARQRISARHPKRRRPSCAGGERKHCRTTWKFVPDKVHKMPDCRGESGKSHLPRTGGMRRARSERETRRYPTEPTAKMH